MPRLPEIEYALQARETDTRPAVSALANLIQKMAAKGMTLARGEIGKRHLEGATDFGIHVMDFARKSIWRQPFHHGIRIKERLVNPFWCCTKHAMELDGISSHDEFSFSLVSGDE